MKKYLCFVFAGMALSFVSGCSNDNRNVIDIIDCSGTKVTLNKSINKIVSVDQSCTAFLTALGKQDKIIGVHGSTLMDKWSPYFVGEHLNHMKRYGYSPSAEAMTEVGADVVFLSNASYAEKLRKSGVPAVCFSYANINELFFAVDMLGTIFGEDATLYVNAWKKYVNDSIDEISDDLSTLESKDKKNVYYINASNNPSDLYSTFGGNSFVEYWINTVGANLVTSEYKNITSIEPEIILAKDPSTVTIGGYAEYTRKNELITDPLWSDIAAVKNNDIYLLPTSFASYEKFSVELPMLLSYTANAYYPTLHEFGGIDTLRDFYQTYYHVSFDDTRLNYLLLGLYPDGTFQDQ